MVPELAVVGDVRVAEQQVVRPDPRRQTLVSAAVNGAVFPEHIVIADFKMRWLALILEVLGLAANDGKGEKLISLSEFRMALQNDMRMEHAVVTECDIRTNDAIRTDADIASQRGKR